MSHCIIHERGFVRGWGRGFRRQKQQLFEWNPSENVITFQSLFPMLGFFADKRKILCSPSHQYLTTPRPSDPITDWSMTRTKIKGEENMHQNN